MALNNTLGSASADSYGDEAGFTAYATSMGWTLLGDADFQEANMRRAAAYLDREYVFVGWRVTNTQEMSWPRYSDVLGPDGFAIPYDEIPGVIIKAQYEVAYLFNQGEDPLAFVAGPSIKKETKKLDVLEKTVEYENGSDTQPRIIAIEGLLRGYITSTETGKSSGMIPRYRG